MQATLKSTLMDKKATAAQINADYSQDKLQADTDQKLFQLGVQSGLLANASKNKAEQLTAQKRDQPGATGCESAKAIEVQLPSSQAKVDQAQALMISIGNRKMHCRCGRVSAECFRRWRRRLR